MADEANTPQHRLARAWCPARQGLQQPEDYRRADEGEVLDWSGLGKDHQGAWERRSGVVPCGLCVMNENNSAFPVSGDRKYDLVQAVLTNVKFA